MSRSQRPTAKGRGSQSQPGNRFESVRREEDLEQLAEDDPFLEQPLGRDTEYLVDDSKSIVSENNSPDLPFRYSINPYRGCLHGCAYCYARPTHEYLGMSAGLDFETKILVKERAPELFRDWLGRSGYEPREVVFSGVTDCYQPIERTKQLTRRCLEVALEARQPIGIVTKNALVVRDADLLAELASRRLAHVALSITTLDRDLAREMEPRTSSPAARLRAIRELSAVGVPCTVMASPMIPGLNDNELPRILEAASEAGARTAAYIVLRMPLTVRPVFLDWLETVKPEVKERVLQRVRELRDGELSDSRFGKRMRGEGAYADQLAQTFRIFRKKYGLDHPPPEPDVRQFRPPKSSSGQMRLF